MQTSSVPVEKKTRLLGKHFSRTNSDSLKHEKQLVKPIKLQSLWSNQAPQ